MDPDVIGFAKDTVGAIRRGEGTEDTALYVATATGYVVANGALFVHECIEAVTDIMSNPLEFLVSAGLDFLYELVEPLQDAVQYVSGDGEALEKAAGKFRDLGEQLSSMSDEFELVADQQLDGWRGDAARAAKVRLAEFADGASGMAQRAGSLAELLFMSSIVMEVIEEVIKSILSEFVTWLIMLWLPALVSAVFSFGASTAAAAATTAVKAVSTTAETTKKISRVTELLENIADLLPKFYAELAKANFKAFGEMAGGHFGGHAPARSDEQLNRAFDSGRMALDDAGPSTGTLQQGLDVAGKPEFDDPDLEAAYNNRPPLGRGVPASNAVATVQEMLKDFGYDLRKSTADGAGDGIFGPETEDAVKAFQYEHGLRIDGLVGPETLDKMDEVLQERKRENGDDDDLPPDPFPPIPPAPPGPNPLPPPPPPPILR